MAASSIQIQSLVGVIKIATEVDEDGIHTLASNASLGEATVEVDNTTLIAAVAALGTKLDTLGTKLDTIATNTAGV